MNLNNFTQAGLNEENVGLVLTALLQFRDQAHIYHWQTKSYAQHEALGSFYESLLAQTDLLGELMISMLDGGIPRFNTNIELYNFDQMNHTEFLNSIEDFFNIGFTNVIDKYDNGHIYNIVDEILACVGKLRYLLTLK